MAQDQPNNSTSSPLLGTALWVVAGFVLFTVATLQLVKPSFSWLDVAAGQETVEEKRSQDRLQNLSKLQVEQAKILNTYGWTDKDAGVARVRIDQGMRLALAELQEKPVKASAIVVPGMEAAAPVPVPAVEETPAPADAAPEEAATPAVTEPVAVEPAATEGEKAE